jgi:predicted hydrolase (HD superfamily)
MTRLQAWEIVKKYVKNENLRRHMLAVEAAMAGYWEYFSKEEGKGKKEEGGELGLSENWKMVGLLHDFDWEIHPTLEEHPQKGEAILEKEGLAENLRRAILSHAEHIGVLRETLMEKTLFAVDELSGLIVAVALMKGRKLENVAVESVLKKFKQKSFAAGVNRQDVEQGAESLGIPLEKHIEIVLEGMKKIAPELGL